MKKYLTLRRKRDELGVVAIIAALLAVVLLMFAAYAVDIGLQVNRKHQLNDTLDAAAQAGAYNLPGNSVTAKSDALAFALAHDPTETGSLKPNVDFWCVVASKLTSGVYQPDSTQMPSTCYPGTAPYTSGVNYKATGLKTSCSSKLCAIPCVEPALNTGTPKIACNTIRVFQGRAVPFGFAPAGGIDEGHTGNVISVACKGSCGTIAPNPMDVAVIADRTVSMLDADVAKLVQGLRGMLQQMTPSQQYVALGTIGRSAQTTTASAETKACNSTAKGLTYGSTSGSAGLWVPISFSKTYQTAPGTLNNTSPLVKGVDCIGAPTPKSDSAQGTTLAAPMKAAAKYLLGLTANNLATLDAGTPRTPTPRKVLIFETDGQPNERQPTGGDTSLSSGDLFSHPLRTTTPVNGTLPDTSVTTESGTAPNIVRTTTVTHRKTITYTYNGGDNACTNLLSVAANAKAQGILVMMIGYNLAGKHCNDYDGVKDDYSNLHSTTNPELSNVTTPTTTSPVQGPEANTPTPYPACPAPHATKKCRTIYQTTTTTTPSESSSSRAVLDVMAEAASPTAVVDGVGGVPSAADSDCSTTAEQTTENADGDFFFCAASGTDMAPIFRTALSQASKGIKLLKGW